MSKIQEQSVKGLKLNFSNKSAVNENVDKCKNIKNKLRVVSVEYQENNLKNVYRSNQISRCVNKSLSNY